MMERVHIELSWPRLAGIASGVFGGSLVVSSAAEFWEASSFRAHGSAGLVLFLLGCVFFFLAFPLYAARAWARLAFLLVTFSILVLLAISFTLMVVYQAWSPSVSHPALRLLIGLCALVAALTPPIVVLLVFLRPDVARAFQPPKSSNQAIERTADRRTLHS
jgi:hypothetical protein